MAYSCEIRENWHILQRHFSAHIWLAFKFFWMSLSVFLVVHVNTEDKIKITSFEHDVRKILYESNTSKQGLFRDNYHQICLRILQVGLEKNVNCELWIWYPKQPDFLFSWLVEYICNHNHVLWRIIIHSPAVSTVSFPLTTKNSLTSVFSLKSNQFLLLVALWLYKSF